MLANLVSARFSRQREGEPYTSGRGGRFGWLARFFHAIFSRV